MLPLDHIPFPDADLDALSSAFEGLGFTVSPSGAYVVPGVAEARCPCRCVFMAEGWFDLLQTGQPTADGRVRPGGALFRTDDLDAAGARLGDLRRHPPYDLERRWDDEPDLEAQTFRLFAIRERISPLPLSVIAHPYPSPAMRNVWFAHPNRALELAGLVFAGGEPGPFAVAARRTLDLEGFEHWPTDAFAQRFGDADVAVKVRTASLAEARRALAADLPITETAGALCVRPPAPLDCGFLFFET